MAEPHVLEPVQTQGEPLLRSPNEPNNYADNYDGSDYSVSKHRSLLASKILGLRIPMTQLVPLVPR
jgi:hypothetical protein